MIRYRTYLFDMEPTYYVPTRQICHFLASESLTEQSNTILNQPCCQHINKQRSDLTSVSSSLKIWLIEFLF